MKHFELTTNTKISWGRTLYQIKALVSFGSVKKDDLGGWVEEEECIKEGAWIYPDARVFRGGVIRGGVIRGGVIWGGEIRGGEIWGGVIRGGVIWGGEIRGGVIRGGEIRGGVIRGGVIRGGVIRGGEIWGGVIRGGVIRGGDSYICIGPIGSRNDFLSAYRLEDKTIEVTTGCFKGDIKTFEKAVKSRHKRSKIAKEYHIAIELIKIRFKVK